MSGKGCWLPLMVKKPSLAQGNCRLPRAHRVIRRLENPAWKEAGTEQVSDARI